MVESPGGRHRWVMHAAESRAVVRASAILLLISLIRWAVPTWTEPTEDTHGTGVLEALTDSARHAVTEAQRRARPLAPDERIDINRASESELDRLPGVGPATAAAVVEARDTGTVFRRAEDLVVVRGIGPSLVARVRNHVHTPDPAAVRGLRSSRRMDSGTIPVDVNRASAPELETLPGVGPAIAARIMAARPFESVADLERVRGVGPVAVERLRGLVSVGRRR